MSRYISNNIASHNLIYPQYILYPNLFFAILYFRYIPLYSYCILIKFVHHSHYIPGIQVHSEIIRICSQLYPMAYIQHIYFLNYIRWHIFHLSSQLHIYISHDIHSASLLNYIPWHIFDILSQLYPMTHIRHIVSIISNDVYSTFHISSQLYSMTHTHNHIHIYIDKHIPMTSPGFMLIYPHRSGQKPTPRSCRFPWSWWPWVKRSRLGSSGTSVQAGKSMGAVLQKDAGCNMWLQELWLLIVGSK